MQHVAAHGEVETAVRFAKLKDRLMLEFQPRCEARIAIARKFQMRVDNIDSQHLRSRKKFRQARRAFARAATGIENSRLRGERVALQ